MKRISLVKVSAFLVALVVSGPARAQDPETKTLLDKYEKRIADLESRLTAWTPETVVHNGNGYGNGYGYGYGCGDDCRRGSIDAGIEFTFLRAFSSLGIQGAIGVNPATDLNFDLETSVRYWVGYTAPSGIGFRVRYWEFDHIASRVLPVNPGAVVPQLIEQEDSYRIDTYVLDAEITGVERLSDCWELAWSGGFRYNEFEQRQHGIDRPAGAPIALNTFQSFESWNIGPVLGTEVRRYLGRSLALFINGRGSLMFGDERERFVGVAGTLPAPVIDYEQDNVRAIFETQLGVEWSRQLNNGGRVFLRTAFEGQWWPNYVGEPGFDGAESVGFAGFTVGGGIRY